MIVQTHGAAEAELLHAMMQESSDQPSRMEGMTTVELTSSSPGTSGNQNSCVNSADQGFGNSVDSFGWAK